MQGYPLGFSSISSSGMPMFKFWNSEHRGSDKSLLADRPMLDFAKPVQPWIATEACITQSQRPLKRRKQSNAAIESPPPAPLSSLKRPRTRDENLATDHASPPQKKVALAPVTESSAATEPTARDVVDTERAREAIEEQFSLEILLKHDELRLINQELAKCQVALEQLRRCHLIPYPSATPTPEQMLNVTNGSGPSLRPGPGDKLPQWAPPFGVTDGPYARHYAKWLIPDPKFDGIVPENPTPTDSWRTRSAVEGRSTRNSFGDLNASQGKTRPSRGTAGQKLHALSSGYPPPKAQSGPCVLKRSDGQTVKLVCIDCHRENFSSTQGFINHCRIAHKRDFKSHEEAAIHCGHPIEVEDVPNRSVTVEEKPTVSTAPPTGTAHPFTRADSLADSEACFSVVRRIQQSLELYRQGRLPGVTPTPTISGKPTETKSAATPTAFAPSTDSPHLSRLLKSRGFDGNLGALVEDAKTKVDFEQVSSPTDDESEDPVSSTAIASLIHQTTPVMRVPARAAMAPVVTAPRPTSSKGTFVPPTPYVTPIPTPAPPSTTRSRPEMVTDIGILDVPELSPSTAVGNNAPSLVSDDGEYDDSADSDSASEMDVSIESISDVEDMEIDDDHTGARGLRHHGSTGSEAATRVRLGKGDTKHVNFVASIQEGKRKQGHNRGIDMKNM